MGQLTRTQIITQGLAEAGYDLTYQTEAGVAFDAFLKRVYESWPWPFLIKRVSGVALNTGATSLVLPVGGGGVSDTIRRILDPIYLYRTDRTVAGKARVKTLLGGPAHEDEDVMNTATLRGSPYQFKVRADTSVWGEWTLYPYPIPDRDLLLAIDYIFTPAAAEVTPIYPNDEVMIYAMKAWAYGHQQKKGEQNDEDSKVAAMLVNDRLRYGSVDGTLDVLPLDSNTFR